MTANSWGCSFFDREIWRKVVHWSCLFVVNLTIPRTAEWVPRINHICGQIEAVVVKLTVLVLSGYVFTQVGNSIQHLWLVRPAHYLLEWYVLVRLAKLASFIRDVCGLLDFSAVDQDIPNFLDLWTPKLEKLNCFHSESRKYNLWNQIISLYYCMKIH